MSKRVKEGERERVDEGEREGEEVREEEISSKQHNNFRTSFSFSSASLALNFFCTSLMKRKALFKFAEEGTLCPVVLCIELRYVLKK